VGGENDDFAWPHRDGVLRDHSSAIVATSSSLTMVAGSQSRERSARRARPVSCSFSQLCTSWTLTRPRPTG
jgi:hypothetical protein